MALTAERVRELLNYDPETGGFTWRVYRGGFATAGARAGRPSTFGHIEISVDRRRYKAHRLAWLVTHSEWPAGGLDHINGNPSDNRICNLRLATQSQNTANTRVRSDNKVGIKGVRKNYNKFEARVRINGQAQYLGLYKSAEEAGAAVRAKHAQLFGEFTPTPERAGWSA